MVYEKIKCEKFELNKIIFELTSVKNEVKEDKCETTLLT